MDEFKILSIDELDAEFVSKLRISKAAPEEKTDSLIPEPVNSNDIISDSAIESAVNNKFSVLEKYGNSESDRPDYKPQTDKETK